MGGAVLPGLVELEDHGASGRARRARQVAQSVVRDRWSQEVAEQGLAALSVVGADGHLGVEVEAVEARLAAGGQEHLSVQVVRSELGGAARGGGLGVGLGQRALVVLEVRALCVFEELARAGHDAGEDPFHLLRARRGRREEGAIRAEGAVEEERVQVHIQAQVRAEALDDEEGPAARCACARFAREATVLRALLLRGRRGQSSR